MRWSVPDTGIDPLVEERELIARCDETTRACSTVAYVPPGGLRPLRTSWSGAYGASTASTGLDTRTSTRDLSIEPRCRPGTGAYLDFVSNWKGSGNAGEAREHRYLASECSRLMGVMDLLERAEADGGWQPVYKALGTPGDWMTMEYHAPLDPHRHPKSRCP